MLESADLEQESADSTADSAANPLRIGLPICLAISTSIKLNILSPLALLNNHGCFELFLSSVKKEAGHDSVWLRWIRHSVLSPAVGNPAL